MKLTLYLLIKEYFKKINPPCFPLAILFSIVAVGNISGTAKAQNKVENRISVKLAEVSLSKAFSTIEEKAGCVINYNPAIFKTEHRISIDVKDTPVQLVIKKILEGTGVGYKSSDAETILLYKLPEPVKPGKISGKVLDEKGEPLPGAGIKVVELSRTASTAVDGSFSLSVAPGTYTVEVRYVSYQTRRITGVVVKEGDNTPLNVSMKPASETLSGVVITGDYKKTSAEGLLARQKNAAELSNGISAEQISRTPDKNIGESLKRISGVSTAENKFVIVRGIGERYNAAVLDGTALPSTEAQNRNFSFDLIPANLVDNIVVSKTVTPDMNTSFGGGLIQINTKDMPEQNFTSFSLGSSFNDRTTGKTFYSHKHGKYDFLGFDDGRRSAPDNLMITNPATKGSLTQEEFQQKIDAQSRRFTHDNFTMYKNPAPINQNYQFTMGRLFSLDTVRNNKLGFTTALTYRNSQNIVDYDNFHRGKWSNTYNNYGNSYNYNVTWGGLLNVGLQLGQHKFSFRNTYTRMYDNTNYRTYGFLNDISEEVQQTTPPNIRDNDDPTFTDLLQNKISGQHQLGKVKLEWDAARTAVKREEKDLITTEQSAELIDGEYVYQYILGAHSEPKDAPMSRQYYKNNENHYTWNIAGTLPFNIGQLRNTIKIGYYGNRKRGGFEWKVVPFTIDHNPNTGLDPSLKYISVADMQKPENMGARGYMYQLYYMDSFAGKSTADAVFAMFDNRLSEKFRLVWGLRGEYYKYKELNNAINGPDRGSFTLKHDPAWRWLPSANLTYGLNSKINLRAAWSIAVVRPELMDNSRFFRYNPSLDGMVTNAGLTSTKINSYDLRAEWFPSLGEVVSINGFYKYFDKPVELSQGASDNIYYVISNSDWARVYGLEFEFRKKLDFIAESQWLSNLTLFGNATLQRSRVQGQFKTTDLATGEVKYEQIKLLRPMYGQSPYLVNLGLQYQESRFGFNVVYNKSGRKTYIVAAEARLIDYEMPRSQVDAQLSYTWMKNRLQAKLNAGNLFDKASSFYKNEPDPVAAALPGYQPGKSADFEPGERRTLTRHFGRTFGLQFNYNF